VHSSASGAGGRWFKPSRPDHISRSIIERYEAPWLRESSGGFLQHPHSIQRERSRTPFTARGIMEFLHYFWEFALLPIAGYFGLRWMGARISESARGGVSIAVGKVLADHQLPLDRQLADYTALITREMESLRQSLALDKERYSKDYALFADQRNRVYARTFQLLEKARGAFGERFGFLTSSVVFDSSPMADIESVAESLKFISAGERSELLDSIRRTDHSSAARLASELMEKSDLRRANHEFLKFKRSWVLHALYFSTDVDRLLGEAVQKLAALSVYADEAIKGHWERKEALESLGALQPLSLELRRAMREEMQAGFSQPRVIT